MPAALLPRPEQSTREGLEALADVVSTQATDGLSLEEQVRKLQRELLAVQAEQTEIRRLIGSASAKDEEHESRLARLEAESARLSNELAEALARVEGAVEGVKTEAATLRAETATLRELVERALKGFSLRTVGQLLLWGAGGALFGYLKELLHK